MAKRIIYKLFIVTFILCTLCSCRVEPQEGFIESVQAQAMAFNYANAAEVISSASGLNVNSDFLEELGEKKTEALLEEAENGTFTELTWLDITGYSYHVVDDMLEGRLNASNVQNRGDNGKSSFSVAFVGDILLDTDFRPMVHANEMGGVLNCIDTAVVDYLNACDVFLINNEFSIGERGTPLRGKTWTFQVHPSRIQILKDLGADIVSLANNHVYDYGEIGFLDTLIHLQQADMPYVGAGLNLGEAAEGYYFIVNGIKVGIVAASRAEKKYFTPVAEADKPGIMGTYDSADFIEVIKVANAQCDILVAYVHWGTENTTVLEDAQINMAREYIDAGVDAVIGGHTHCLQGMEYYNGVPIVYSVGNFWFNSKTLDSCVITLNIDREMKTEISLLPLKQEGCETRLLTEFDERRALFDRVESYAPQGVTITDEGVILPVEESIS